MNYDPNDIITDVLERDKRSREALSMLLEQQGEKKGHLLALRLRMGETPSYLATVSLGWVEQHVHFAGDLPIFKGKTKEIAKEVLIDEGTIDEIQQRNPDWRRQLQMAMYLATRPNRKFPPLLVVGYQGWVYDKNADKKWKKDGCAEHDSVTATALDPKNMYYDLDVKDTMYYALDGQHRLMAIMGVKELLDKGQLVALNRDGTQKKAPIITREQVITEICKKTGEDEGIVHERLQRVMNEDHIGIEIIPAVVSGEKYAEALSRLRSVFVDVNENAKQPLPGESILLDENRGFRIVARRVMVTHRLFKDKVEQKDVKLGETSPCYTTLKTIVEIAGTYLRAQPKFSGWDNPMFGDKNLGFSRPDESEIDAATGVLGDYFTALEKLPSHTRFMQGKQAGEIREEQDEDNIFFRPMAQMAFADAVAQLVREREKPLEGIVRKLSDQEDKNQLKLHNKSAPWFGVLCNPIDGAMRKHKRHQEMCTNMLVYLLGGGIQDDEEREELRNNFADMRQSGENEWIDRDGETVKSQEKVQLPHLW